MQLLIPNRLTQAIRWYLGKPLLPPMRMTDKERRQGGITLKRIFGAEGWYGYKAAGKEINYYQCRVCDDKLTSTPGECITESPQINPKRLLDK